MDLNGKTAIVTGASRGIGTYIAKTLARHGANIIAVARSEAGLQETKVDIENSGGSCQIIPFDLSNIDGLEGLVADIWSNHGPIQFLVNNAGIEHYQHYDRIQKSEILSILNINLHCPLELSRAIMPRMLDNSEGHIINISSLAGKKGVAYNSIYSASKAGLLMWADGMRQEYNDSPIDISVVCPGFISEAGMFNDGQIDPPPLLGSSKPQKVADAVIKALKKGSCEIIVNSGPIRPLLALGQISWKLADKIVRWFGVPALSRKRISF
ncbi:MAG: SDR family NAD(P)-dependent oxidoreductase [Candidatus Marinimicrobia bacterium]|nr:SDR family NAD(P)-dependent oxidoreductase [Candidatus Neomarinimicrobiota bacterium]MBT3676905.1 SDR family NAD(P)-dependent oxidoreductase [Candidatus Neomarinimicrobiota bacterium]MBT3762336.1 SDR family NAD(P)-dependent oxidoreductase [Candidatus Neomarinimicrobiota bacterium]MBT4067251.1 SDR family NAD(P)-dependent oxidoreductase [Candidatus Neomarinimicrobiota bacterium]MBT4271074.1 SDR family NAD(P)-dependent oxidoreductase [Candidatus Neomarinimicrobiota bacterium]